jgi:hypothetical protein
MTRAPFLALLLWQAVPGDSFATNRRAKSSWGQRSPWHPAHSHSHSHDHGDDGENCVEEDGAQVGDYVRGLHGGKYQFEQQGSLSLESRQFVENLYSGGGSQFEEDLSIPEWAQNVQLPAEHDDFDILEFGTDEFLSLHIDNEDPTWGKFYAQVKHATLTDSPFYIDPFKGELAPRTGSVDISIQPIEECAIDDGWWLVLSTEELSMFYKLVRTS